MTWYMHCTDIEKICFKIANKQISHLLTELSARNISVVYFQGNNEYI